MLFWSFIITIAVGIVCVVVGYLMYNHTRFDTEWLFSCGWFLAAIGAIAAFIAGIIIIDSNAALDAKIAEKQQVHNSLVYQLENNIYENDNDLGKKSLYDQIQYYNSDLAYYRGVQDDFWLGIFYPDIYDQLEFIELDNTNE